MAQLFEIHPDNPQPRLLRQACALLDKGEVLAVPTDSGYALACHLDDKSAADRLRHIRGLDDKHHLTLLCRDLSELANYARVDNRQYRLLRQGTPGPYAFILEASKEVPRRLSHPSRKALRLRLPDPPPLPALLAEHGGPLLATTLLLPDSDEAFHDADSILDALDHELGGVIDSGACPRQAVTVVDLTPMGHGGAPELVREGAGDPARLGM